MNEWMENVPVWRKVYLIWNFLPNPLAEEFCNFEVIDEAIIGQKLCQFTKRLVSWLANVVMHLPSCHLVRLLNNDYSSWCISSQIIDYHSCIQKSQILSESANTGKKHACLHFRVSWISVERVSDSMILVKVFSFSSSVSECVAKIMNAIRVVLLKLYGLLAFVCIFA